MSGVRCIQENQTITIETGVATKKVTLDSEGRFFMEALFGSGRR